MGNKKHFITSLWKNIKNSPGSGRTIALGMFFLLLIKQIVVFNVYGAQLQGENILATLSNYLGFLWGDVMILGIVLFLVFFNMFVGSRLIRIICNIINIIILKLFIIDTVVLYFFQSRLSVFDLYTFITTSNDTYFTAYIIGGIAIFLLAMIILFFVVQKYFLRMRRTKQQVGLAVIFFLFAFFVSYFNLASTEYKSLQKNVLTINREATKQMGSADIEEVSIGENSMQYEDYFTTIPGQNKKINVILISAESFSTVDSKRAGGLNDNMPLFDKMQADGITFSNFMANGCTSESAHIALLQGVEPRQLPVEKAKREYYTYANYTDALPVFFNNLGYKTTFLSTVALDFLDQITFLQNIQFQEILGEENFEDETTYIFDAAPDHVLYDKALELIQSYDSQEPYFLAMQTISSHVPYNTPYGKGREESFKYVDRNIYAFYQKLKKSGFFENGILVIVGDHRKVESMPGKEFKKYGMSAHSRVLATVIGKGIEADQEDENIVQHLDIFYSLKYLLGSGDIVVQKDFNNIFDPNQEEREWGVRYCRFSEKNYVVIKKDGKAYTLRTGLDPYIQNFISAYKYFEYKNLIGTGHDPAYFTNYVTEVMAIADVNIIAHRGDPTQHAENSFKGFALAKENEVQGIEFDVSFTKDGKNVVYHGPSLKDTKCGKKKNIYNYTLQELQTQCPLDNGEKILTLEDLLQQTNTRFETYFLEIKVHNPAQAKQQTFEAISTVTQLGMQDRVIFTSYDKTANEIIGGYPGIKAGRDTDNQENMGAGVIGNFPHKYFLTHKDIITEDLVKTMETLGKKVVVYTVNTEEEFQKIYDMGVRNFITDDVVSLKKAIKNYIINSVEEK